MHRYEHVGYMIPNASDSSGYHIVCEDCLPDEEKTIRTPVFHVNIYPYKQECAVCGKLLVKGKTSAWPTLFE